MRSLQFRVLYREFLFRMVDREVLSAHAQGDANKLLGRFAAMLVIISLPFAAMPLGIGNAGTPHEAVLVAAWSTEHALIATTMLVVGLFAVLSWDSTFPDRRDVLVLAPLPIRANTIFLAKGASLAVALSVTVATFNAAPAFSLPFVLAPPSANLFGMIFSFGLWRAVIAYWLTMLAAGAFIFCCALIVQGMAAQLPRRIFLRLSSFLQIAVFCLIVAVYFLQPSMAVPTALLGGSNERLLAWLPSYWFLGLFQQLNGSFYGPSHSVLAALATRAWLSLGIGSVGACLAFFLSYIRTLRKIVEEPDIVPGSGRLGRLPRFGGSLQTAVVHFSVRTLFRSRTHRVIVSFYAGIGFAILILFLKTPVAQRLSQASAGAWHQPGLPLLASSFLMPCFWTLGVRVVFAMPLQLRANWIFRITELRGPTEYLTAARRALWTLALLPVWTLSAVVFLCLWPWRPAIGHLAVLGLIGMTLIEFCLHDFRKIPFTCSFLPGKSNLHMTFVLCILLLLNLTYWCAEFERRALSDPLRYAWMVGGLCIVGFCARWRTQAEVNSREGGLKFEEELIPVIGGLGLHRDGVLHIDRPAKNVDTTGSRRIAPNG
jgi:hypothetical protein